MEQNDNDAPQPMDVYEMPMKWHKYLIYFSLWAAAVMNVIAGVAALTGSVYVLRGADPEMIYRSYEGLKTFDVMLGLTDIVLAVLLIVTRFALAGYKENGPRLLMISYAVNIAFTLVCPIIAVAIRLPVGRLFGAPAAIENIVMLAVNRIYYHKRAHLFVN